MGKTFYHHLDLRTDHKESPEYTEKQFGHLDLRTAVLHHLRQWQTASFSLIYSPMLTGGSQNIGPSEAQSNASLVDARPLIGQSDIDAAVSVFASRPLIGRNNTFTVLKLIVIASSVYDFPRPQV